MRPVLSPTTVRPIEALLACPACRSDLQVADDASSAVCVGCGAGYGSDPNGVWHFMPAGEDQNYKAFCRQYRSVREAEGWASGEGDYYRRLPDVDAADPQNAIWRMRQRSFVRFLAEIIEPLEESCGRSLTIVDAGAGNGWLSNRLACRGHQVVAVDILDDRRHGLGAHVHYHASFVPVRALFDRLPLADDAADAVVFNASLHYADDLRGTVEEALRVLRPSGRFVVLDSPVYRDVESGREMIQEKQQMHENLYGMSTQESTRKGYLVRQELEDLGKQLGVEWKVMDPNFGFRWLLQRWFTRLRKGREAARMPVLVGVSEPDDPLPLPSAHERHGWLLQKLGYFWRWIRAILFLRSRYDTFATESIRGYSLVVQPGVFNPALFDSSQWFTELIEDGEIDLGRRVLDMGTGAGLTAVAAAAHGSYVTAVDINPAAVRSARKNALLNGLAHNIDVRKDDLFSSVNDRFDTVFFNPPFYQGKPADGLDHAWRGMDIAPRFAAGLRRHLKLAGKAYVVLSSRGAPESFLRAFREHELTIEVFRVYDLICETQVVYRISQPDEGLC